MSTVSENIKFLRKNASHTQQTFADALNLKRSLVGAYEEGRADPRISNLIKISELFGIRIDDLVETSLWKMSDTEYAEFKKGKQGQKFKVLAISVDAQDRENIEFIPQKAAAGYLNGYSDPQYIAEMPKFQLPFLPEHNTYRAFEISGDSMLPIRSGTIVIGAYEEKLHDIKNGQTYILVTQSEGVVFKRVFNYMEEKGNFYMVSDNRQYSPYELDPKDILEIWEAKAFISVDFIDPNLERANLSVNELASMVLELKKEVSTLKSTD